MRGLQQLRGHARRLRAAVRKRSISSAGPAATQAVGPFSAASERPAGKSLRPVPRPAARTDSMTPAGMRLHQRAALRDQPCSVAQGDITPARTAAANSPTLWPISAAGWMPSDCNCRASAYSSAKVAGCVTDGRLERRRRRPRTCAPAGRTAASPRSACRHSSKAARNAGSCACSSRPMPAYCAPWPGNMKTGARHPARRSRRRLAQRIAAAQRLQRLRPRCRRRRTARCAKALRPTRSVCATSASDDVGCALEMRRRGATAAARARPRVRAESSSSCGPTRGARRRAAAAPLRRSHARWCRRRRRS